MADEGWKKPIFIVKWMTKYFDSLMEKLDAIQNMFGTSGDADVSSADIRLGKKAYNGTTLVTGTMPENVAVAETLTAGEAYVIPQGYHDGTGKVTADSLASQTDGTATAAQILSGKTAYVDGVKVTGSMTNNGAKTASLAAGASYTIPVGYHDGTGKVTANSLASQTDGTATAAQILSGKTAYVDGKKVTGSMGNKAGTTVEASAVTQDDTNTYFNIPAAGYYDTNSKVYTPNSNLVKLLWTNPNPSSAFSAQTVSLDFTNYTHAIVEMAQSDTSDWKTRVIVGKNEVNNFGGGYVYYSDPRTMGLQISLTDSGVIFKSGTSSGSVNDGFCIPQKIYGINITLP